jgi:hypothetical protein
MIPPRLAACVAAALAFDVLTDRETGFLDVLYRARGLVFGLGVLLIVLGFGIGPIQRSEPLFALGLYLAASSVLVEIASEYDLVQRIDVLLLDGDSIVGDDVDEDDIDPL